MPVPVEIPLSKELSKTQIAEVDTYWKERMKSLKHSLRDIREEKVTQMRKIYYGTPREKTKSFPWQNASNVVVQLVGSYIDQFTAKVVMATVGSDPLFVAGLQGEWKREEEAEEQREAIQEWLSFSGLEPSHLNLMMKYPIWIRTFAKYGLGAVKLLPELVVEKVAASYSEDGGVQFQEFIRHDGPVCLNLMFEDFMIPGTQKELERYPIVAQRARMEKFEVERFLNDKTFDKKTVLEILKSPDRQGPEKTIREIEDGQGVKSDDGGPNSDEWDIYESYFPYAINRQRFHVIYTGHLESGKPIKRVFNWLPENSIPYLVARLGSDGERAYGLGFCEMLKDYQEEVTAIHNRRGDASTLANTNLLRAGDGTQLDSNFSIYPNALVTGPEGSIEVIPLGRTANETIKDEQQTLQLATDRAGIGPSSSGSGSGTVTKKGQYSALGAFPIMQEGNTRSNLNITEFRTSHYTLGRQKLLYDAHFGVSERDIRALGEKGGKHLKKALDNVRQGRMHLPIRAATGSVNKEIEKQNLMLLLNNIRAHDQQVAQLLQAAANPQNPPEIMHFLLSSTVAATFVMRRICKEFGIEDPSAAIPDLLGTVMDRITGIEKQVEMQKAQQIAQQIQQRQQQPGGGQPQLPAPGGGPQAVPPAQQAQREDMPNERTQ
jgi:hypothetical protein